MLRIKMAYEAANELYRTCNTLYARTEQNTDWEKSLSTLEAAAKVLENMPAATPEQTQYWKIFTGKPCMRPVMY